MRLTLEDWNLRSAEQLLVVDALATAGTIREAANLLGITTSGVKRRIRKHHIQWPRKPEGVTR